MNKRFSVEDLIPSGKNYATYFHTEKSNFSLMRDSFCWQQKNVLFYSEKKKNILSLEKINEYLTTTLRLKKRKEFPVLYMREGEYNIGFYCSPYFIYYAVAEEIFSSVNIGADAQHIDISPDYNYVSFTRKNNLYVLNLRKKEIIQISKNDASDIITGQLVYRNEFGISKGTCWSPDNKKLAFYNMDELMVGEYPLVDTTQKPAELIKIKYPMAGSSNQEVQVGIYELESGKTIYLKTGNPKDRYLTNLAWRKKELIIAELNREQTSCVLVSYNTETGNRNNILFEENNPYYVEPESPPCILKNGDFIWQSKRSGFNHLYLYASNGMLQKQLTSGAWEVVALYGVDKEEEYILFSSTEKSPLERHIFKYNLRSGEKTCLTDENGFHEGIFITKKNELLDIFSSLQLRQKINIIDIPSRQAIVFDESENPFAAFNTPDIEIGTIKAADNETDLYYRIIKPADFDEKKKYPVILYVYGGPHVQLIQERWLGGIKGWELLLAQRGYIVFSVDNRGSAFRGRKFEEISHGQLGFHEMKDQVKGICFLKQFPFVDKNRIGVHGWSFGGYMTISLMLHYPTLFKAGIAGAPVTDWSLYEIMYGERYMQVPSKNKKGYRKTNVLRYIHRLKGKLMLIHGDMDDVVVMQHSLNIVRKCSEKDIPVDFQVYSNQKHHIEGVSRIHLIKKVISYFDDFL